MAKQVFIVYSLILLKNNKEINNYRNFYILF